MSSNRSGERYEEVADEENDQSYTKGVPISNEYHKPRENDELQD